MTDVPVRADRPAQISDDASRETGPGSGGLGWLPSGSEMAGRVAAATKVLDTYRWERESKKYLGVFHGLTAR